MKSSKVILVLVLAAVLISPVSASAATNAGVKPGSFWYGFDIAFEKINLFFTFNSGSKARNALQYADERLAEAQVVAGGNNTKAVETAMAGYKNSITIAAEKAGDIKEKEKAEALLTTISDSTSKHQEVLADVLSKVPNEAKESINKAIEVSKKGHEGALQKITELKSKAEQIKQGVAESKWVGNRDGRLTEIEPIKKESSSEVSIKQSSPKIVGKQPAEPNLVSVKQDNTILSRQKQDLKKENYKESVILIHERFSEDIKKFVESIDSSYLTDRKNKLLDRASFIRNKLSFSDKSTAVNNDAVIFNEMVEIYAQQHELEVKDINTRLSQINENLNYLNRYREEYNKLISTLSADPTLVVSFQELENVIKYENDNSRNNIHQAKTNILNVLSKYYSTIDWWENEYQKSAKIIESGINKIFGDGGVSKTTYYQPMPQTNYGLSLRQQLILNPIKCTITDDGLPNPLQTFVTCY